MLGEGGGRKEIAPSVTVTVLSRWQAAFPHVDSRMSYKFLPSAPDGATQQDPVQTRPLKKLFLPVVEAVEEC